MPHHRRAAAFSLFTLAACSTPADRTGDYLGETPPGPTPAHFAAGFVTTSLAERDATFSADGNHFLYSVSGSGGGTILWLRRTRDRWSTPRIAPFSGSHNDLEPAFAPDGRTLWFVSRRATSGDGESKSWNIWRTTWTGTTWSAPEPVPDLDDGGHEFYPSQARSGAMYFTARRADSLGGEDLYRARPAATGFAPAENLGPNVNSEHGEFNAFVAPDESYLLFSSTRPGGPGGGDLYVCFGDGTGRFEPAILLGSGINGPSVDYCPSVTPDGRYLLFTSRRTGREGKPRGFDNFEQLRAALGGIDNGNDNLYWVDFDVVRRLRRDG